jgi:hypothetical protein
LRKNAVKACTTLHKNAAVNRNQGKYRSLQECTKRSKIKLYKKEDAVWRSQIGESKGWFNDKGMF